MAAMLGKSEPVNMWIESV